MDPTATLRMIDDAIRTQSMADAIAAVLDLKRWLDADGFAPDWTRYPNAASYYQAMTWTFEDADLARLADGAFDDVAPGTETEAAATRAMADLLFPTWRQS